MTAGDVSIAARGDSRATEAIIRTGLSHRVLADVSANDGIRQRLSGEGVRFVDGGPLIQPSVSAGTNWLVGWRKRMKGDTG